MGRIEQEKVAVGLMIELYCRHKEGNGALCASCRQLLLYAHKRLDACRYAEHKCSCKRCPTHCYAPAYRARIRQVMRYAGPRMLFYHPIVAIKHLLQR